MSDWEWFESTRDLQENSFGMDYSALEGEALGEYITWNHTALIDELGEFLKEVQWKPWAKDRGKVFNRDAAVGELVDAAHFLANLACALGTTDEEWESRYQEKQRRNAARQAEKGGYDSKATKCPGCARELDKPNATVEQEVRTFGTEFPLKITTRCAACGLHLGERNGS